MKAAEWSAGRTPSGTSPPHTPPDARSATAACTGSECSQATLAGTASGKIWSRLSIQVTAQGWFFVRGVALQFDKYLQADRNLPVHLLDEMVRQMPEGVFLSSLKQDNQTIVLAGVAQSQERVSELLRNLNASSKWLTRPELVEIVAANLALSPREQRRVSNFSIRVTQVRNTGEAKSIPAAGAQPPAAVKR